MIKPAIAALALILAACQSVPAPEPVAAAPALSPGLSDTGWRFTRFTSMDDAQGVTEAGGRTFTLFFHADGTVTGTFDCNNVSARWNEGPLSATGTALYLTPIRMTRMACPADKLAMFLGSQLAYVSSYTIAEGEMHMALQMDGGIISFEPLD
ncbi:META domain-containing protein [Croceicoccus bisphenolivorans]|uniref:META domain-containing protein n=1 Tax=Croceicoccus bisphenolivorans TaxID=1783232 RepID=UPI00082B44FF|nr:META domain-containing protein [Croceicoccus bisphenolivorans]